MSSDQHFAAISLWFRAAFTRDPLPIREGYCVALFDPKAGPWVEQLRKVYSSVARTVTIGDKQWVRLQARTNAEGWLMAQAGNRPESPKDLASLEPLVLPMGQAARIWWTDNEAMFDEVLREGDEEDAHLDPSLLPVARLMLDVNQPLPDAVKRRLAELNETLDFLQGDPAEAFPEQWMQSVGDGETRAIVLEDHALELARDLAHDARELRAVRAQIPVHLALANLSADILDKEAPADRMEGSDVLLLSTVAKYKWIRGGAYHHLRNNLEQSYESLGHEIESLSDQVARLFPRAIHELLWHSYERTDEILDALQEAAGFGHREALSRAFFTDDPEEGVRLIEVANGTRKAEPGNPQDVFADTLKVFVKYQAIAGKASDAAQKATEWTHEVLATALTSDKIKAIGKADVVAKGIAAITKFAAALGGKDVEVPITNQFQEVQLEGSASPARIPMDELGASFKKTSGLLGRAADFIKIFNVMSLGDKILSGAEVSLVDLLGDLHGTVEGLEVLYRIWDQTAAKALATPLERVAPVVNLAMGFQNLWGHVQTGKASAVVLSGMSLGALLAGVAVKASTTLTETRAKRVGLLLVVASAGLQIGAYFVYSESEKYLAVYDPDLEKSGDGPYGDGLATDSMCDDKLSLHRLNSATKDRVDALLESD